MVRKGVGKTKQEDRRSVLRIEQIAFRVLDHDKAKVLLESLGIQTEVEDRVYLRSDTYGSDEDAVCDLRYSYPQTGDNRIELEYIETVKGNSWFEAYDVPCITHIGMHVENEEEISRIVDVCRQFGCPVVQDSVTLKHHNSAVPESRRYHYVIINTRGVLGFDIKLIRRVDLAYGEPWNNRTKEEVV